MVADRRGADVLEKNFLWLISGVVGDESIEDVSALVAGVSSGLLAMSDSSAERRDALDDVLDADRRSGALSAWTLVVEINSVGREILERIMLPVAYL